MSQWIPAVTALGGVLLGFLLNQLGERRRNVREDRLRFVQEKLRAYADFATVCKRADRLKQQIADTQHRRMS